MDVEAVANEVVPIWWVSYIMSVVIKPVQHVLELAQQAIET